MSEHKYQLWVATNMYLSKIQRGIQTAHVVGELSQKYDSIHASTPIMNTWAGDDKTIQVRNGGYQSNLEVIYRTCEAYSTRRGPFPFARFYEEKDALNGALTAVGIILPESVYKYFSRRQNGPKVPWDPYMQPLQDLVDVWKPLRFA